MDNKNLEHMQYVFANIFIISNRLTTVCEKIQTDITIKQWLLLAIVSRVEGIQNLSDIGRLMGCSRQNVKKLANPLSQKGYIKLIRGDNNSLIIKLTEKFYQYSNILSDRHLNTLSFLFEEFTYVEISNMVDYIEKFNQGLDKLEAYGESLDEGK